MPGGTERAIKGMFLPQCCFAGVVQDCDEAPLLLDMETPDLRTKGTV